MESKTGSLLTFIAAIINFIISGLVFLVSLVFLAVVFVIKDYNLGISIPPFLLFIIILLVAVILFIIASLSLVASRKMKHKKTVRKGAIWAIILGAITIGQISGILSLIGGIIGIIDADK